MSDEWLPDVRDRLALLRSDASRHPGHTVTVAPPDQPGTMIGITSAGTLFLDIDCRPSDVATNVSSARVKIGSTEQGCRVTIDQNVSDWTAGSFLLEVFARLSQNQPRGRVADMALRRWADLVSRPAGPRLGDRELAGLFGELEILELAMERGALFDHWTGWRREAVDFRFPGLVVEVKATLSPNYRRVRIHGLEQLADPLDGSPLILVLRRLQLSPEGRSLPLLTDSLVDLGADRAALLGALHNVGYSEAHRTDYEATRFISEVVALREISADHPRLTPAAARDIDLQAIDRVDYVLNLNGTDQDDMNISIEELFDEHLGPAS
ncbi:PD-(D/E)XK motif protein [Euzebya tangerina]|uniref:PD-(D/E)XK motif protein n=1 Tax=Euzebya tangerina TaxID=591198 RepID=UPI000E3192BE|nr:PD-(D/E)XK motif protein [Euzebya tangerina]